MHVAHKRGHSNLVLLLGALATCERVWPLHSRAMRRTCSREHTLCAETLYRSDVLLKDRPSHTAKFANQNKSSGAGHSECILCLLLGHFQLCCYVFFLPKPGAEVGTEVLLYGGPETRIEQLSAEDGKLAQPSQFKLYEPRSVFIVSPNHMGCWRVTLMS